jgi:hypothetical protein
MAQVLDEIKHNRREPVYHGTFEINGVRFQVKLNNRKYVINSCIEIYDHNNQLELQSYTCQDKRSDETDNLFFQFFYALGKKLHVGKLIVKDTFKERVGGCLVSNYIYALAGEKTFYQRFGFENTAFNELIKELQGRRVIDLFNQHELNQLRLKLRQTGIESYNLKIACKRMLTNCRDGGNDNTRDVMQVITQKVHWLFWSRSLDDIVFEQIIRAGGKRRSRKRTSMKRGKHSMKRGKHSMKRGKHTRRL